LLKLTNHQVSALRKARGTIARQELQEECGRKYPGTRWDAPNQTLVVPEPTGGDVRAVFDKESIISEVVTSMGHRRTFSFDEKGRFASSVSPMKREVRVQHDKLNRMCGFGVAKTDFSIRYDNESRADAIQFPDARAYRFLWNPAGRLSGYRDRSGAERKFEYSDSGELSASIDPLGRRLEFTRTGIGNSAVRYPDGSTQAFKLSPERPVLEIQDRDGTARAIYFKDGLPTTIVWADENKTEHQYDSKGRLTFAQSSGEFTSFQYDDNDKRRIERSGTAEIVSELDEAGRVIRLTMAKAGTVAYSYDLDGRVVDVETWNGEKCLFEHDGDNDLIRIRYPNGLTEHREYSDGRRLAKSRIVDASGRMVAEDVYHYDQFDRLVSQHNSGAQARQFGYDAEDRIASEGVPGLRPSVYRYDKQGNIVDADGERCSYGSMDEPRRIGDTTVKYSAIGQAIQIESGEDSLELAWNAQGMLGKASNNNGAVRFSYDALGRRVRKSNGMQHWRYIWSGLQLVAEESEDSRRGSGSKRDYLYLPDEPSPFAFREGGRMFWLQRDQRGAVTRVFDDAGRVVWHGTYSAFGELHLHRGADGPRQPWRLAGQYWDHEVRLSYNFCRTYSPSLRTYLSLDPKWFDWGNANYSYAQNNALNRVDAYGDAALAPLIAVVAVVGAAAVGAGVAAYQGTDVVSGAIGGVVGLAAAVGLVAVLPEVAVGGILGTIATLGLDAVVGAVASAAQSIATDLADWALNGAELIAACVFGKAGVAAKWGALFGPMFGVLTRGAGRLFGRLFGEKPAVPAPGEPVPSIPGGEPVPPKPGAGNPEVGPSKPVEPSKDPVPPKTADSPTGSPVRSGPGKRPDAFNSFGSDDQVPAWYRDDPRFPSLATEPTANPPVTGSLGRREAMAGLEAEKQNLIPGPIRRGPAAIEFFDGKGHPWDVKTPPSKTPPNSLDVDKAAASVIKELRKPNVTNPISEVPGPRGVILDSTYLNEADHSAIWNVLTNTLTDEEFKRIIEINVKL